MRDPRSISTPITLTALAAALSIALLVGWTIILADEDAPSWLLVLGIISFVVITFVVVVFGVALAREILETRRQNAFIDSVTHELKSPLASLKLCLSTLNRSELSDAQRVELRGLMNEDVDRLAIFIDDVLEASRLSYAVGTTAEKLDLPTLLVRCVERVAVRHGAASVAGVRIEVAPELAVSSDPTLLESILKNLIDNAVKYSDPPADVTVSAREEGAHLVIEVTDRGIGLDRADLKRIFSRFYRVDREEVRKRKGTGIGLFIVAAMARRLGGKLVAHSEGVGLGTRMELRLPRGRKA